MIVNAFIGKKVIILDSKHCGSKLKNKTQATITKLSKNGGFEVATVGGKTSWQCNECVGAVEKNRKIS